MHFRSSPPQRSFWGDNIFRILLQKRQNETPKPLWFRGFSHRYLFRFAMLVAGAGVALSDWVGFGLIGGLSRFAVPGVRLADGAAALHLFGRYLLM